MLRQMFDSKYTSGHGILVQIVIKLCYIGNLYSVLFNIIDQPLMRQIIATHK